LRRFVLFAFLAVTLAVLTLTAVRVGGQGGSCPPGSLVVNASGTYICALQVSDYTPVFTSLTLNQFGNVLNGSVTCLTAGGCSLNLTAYDYSGGSLTKIGSLVTNLTGGSTQSFSYECSGVGVVSLEVNDVFVGWFTPAVVNVPTAVGTTLKELASRDPMVMVVAGLLVVSVPLGWSLSREQGLSGLALAGASLIIYSFVLLLTTDVVVATLISVVSAFVGIVYVVMQGGQP
jgi:hypothetical protein